MEDVKNVDEEVDVEKVEVEAEKMEEKFEKVKNAEVE